MSALAEKLWQDLSSLHLASLNGGEALQSTQSRRNEHVPGSFAGQMFSSMSVQSVAIAGAASSGGSSSISSPGSFDDDLQICESAAQFDVIGHALSSACATLRTGSRLLREIELMIGLPREHGIAAKGLPVGPLPYTSQIGCATGRATDPPSPCIYIDSSCVARLIVVLWDEQGQRFGSASDGQGDGSEKALTVLRRCYMDILGLYKRHLSHYEIV
ncbi:uncharacterized protein CTRU02_204191 [Colletotrichum truncatum]|uniref:Uncharacterized protein n=1 Tax=Colletotrichum truncatum TaxID=5467 RepID=A0ACC3ZBA3_COLTU|nr:uncharacterized protein CTRU02_10044 [Colletotrichum truncatum]KAF6787749.1 hypothetical protein CTRU02_10044 [Colletotrichum truncatum]